MLKLCDIVPNMRHPIKILPDRSYLLMLFIYDPLTGILRWRVGRNRGKIAGVKKYNYGTETPHSIRVKLGLGRQDSATAHRIIWKLMTGEDAPDTIDHWDRDPFNNRWGNLRIATMAEQSKNRTVPKTYRKRQLPIV
jgi:hypothetical protein